MRIVVDLQGAQSVHSRAGEVGESSLRLLQEMIRHRGEHEIVIALNGLFPETIEPIRAQLQGVLPLQNIRVWYAAAPVSAQNPDNAWRRQVAELTREAFLANLNPDIVWVANWFEGFEEDAVTSLGKFARSILTVVTLFDLPRLLHQKADRRDQRFQAWFSDQVKHLACADQILVTSESLRQQGIKHLGLSDQKVVNLAAKDPMDWSCCAQQFIVALERLHAERSPCCLPSFLGDRLPKLAFLSPLPPERSGIADYSAELLPELARYYEIDVIVAQEKVSDSWVHDNLPIRSVDWFVQNVEQYDRILYHFGNSPFHQHMFDLIEQFPGVIVLHDFFLGHIQAHRDLQGFVPEEWSRELYHAHGYGALRERWHAEDVSEVVFRYPCNLSILQQAIGVIVHSTQPSKLAQQWYGAEIAQAWSVIPLLRKPAEKMDKRLVRQKLGLEADAFIVACFGILGVTKQNHRLLDAWLNSSLTQDKRCILLFVGNHGGGDYGNQILQTIQSSGLQHRIRITGWVDGATFQNYLVASDVAVQLRTLSRGETSAALLDCMNYGLPTIANAHGSMAELSPDVVWMLPDEFRDDELIEALEVLKVDQSRRERLGQRAREEILHRYSPELCTQQYQAVIEKFYAQAAANRTQLIQAIARLEDSSPAQNELLEVSTAIALSLPNQKGLKQLLVDVSALVQHDLKTGIERVTRSILRELLLHPPKGYRVEPVYVTPQSGGYRYARKFTLKFLNCPQKILWDDRLETTSGDIFLSLDVHYAFTQMLDSLQMMRQQGVSVYFVVYDLLPVLLPHCFPKESEGLFRNWLRVVVQADGAICISRTVADDLRQWLIKTHSERLHELKIEWFHLGSDLENSVPTVGMPEDASTVLAHLTTRPTFLMVGTVEPRKGHAQVLAAFERLWDRGVQANLVIVGKAGWMVETLAQKLSHHSQLNQCLFWLQGISDEYLEKVYGASTALIAASEAEGFGLPLIEAAQRGLPIVARDIPVFREVVGDHGFYFAGTTPEALASSLETWLQLYDRGEAPQSGSLEWLDWCQSTQQLLKGIGLQSAIPSDGHRAGSC